MTRRQILAGAAAALAATVTRAGACAANPVGSARSAVTGRSAFDDILGESRAINELRHRARSLLEVFPRSSELPPSIFIQGEAGTGNELLARTLHAAGPRHDRPFVAFHAGCIPESLIESALFGHESGAFPGALEAVPGVFQAAHTGVLYLEEVRYISRPLQFRVIEAVQSRTVQRVEGGRVESADVWLIVVSGSYARRPYVDPGFRSAIIEIPPLRDRGDDILLLADHYVERYAAAFGVQPKRLSSDARAALRAYDWPLNVRELVNCVERAVLLSKGQTIEPGDLGIVRSIARQEGHPGHHPAAYAAPPRRAPSAAAHSS